MKLSDIFGNSYADVIIRDLKDPRIIMNTFTNAFGDFELQRYPKTHDPTLKAWDAADHLALQKIRTNVHPINQVLVVNDEFGALTISLAKTLEVTHWSDSYLAQIACQRNQQKTQHQNIHYLASTEPLVDRLFDLIILRPPKNLGYFEFQLQHIAINNPNTQVLIPIMQKFITNGLREIINRYLDKIEPGLAEKKARVISARTKSNVELIPRFHIFNYQGLEIANLPNVFSSQRLDIGARFLLDNLPALENIESLADLGCGNGVLSAFCAHKNPELAITGFDESYMAIASAQETFRINDFKPGHFVVSHALSKADDNEFDLILCNPPFHQQRRISTDVAHLMFKQSKSKLKTQGRLVVVANRHLGYTQQLNRVFNRVSVINSNPKFVILEAFNH